MRRRAGVCVHHSVDGLLLHVIATIESNDEVEEENQQGEYVVAMPACQYATFSFLSVTYTNQSCHAIMSTHVYCCVAEVML